MPCTGCSLVYTNVVGSAYKNYSYTLPEYIPNSSTTFRNLFTTNIYADGIGALTGVTGFLLGRLSVNVDNLTSGRCISTTGLSILTGSLSGSPLDIVYTGNIEYTYVTGCNQQSPCRMGKLSFQFSGNPDLYSGAPTARTNITAYVYGANNGLFPHISYEPLSLVSPNLASGQLSMTNTRIDCGQSYIVQLSFITLIPGQTGQIYAYDQLRINCLNCTQ
jgi:hypothetical protein